MKKYKTISFFEQIHSDIVYFAFAAPLAYS